MLLRRCALCGFCRPSQNCAPENDLGGIEWTTECLKTLVLYSAERDIPAIVGQQGVLNIGDREERFSRKDRGTLLNIPFGEESLTSDSRSRDFEQRQIRNIRDAESLQRQIRFLTITLLLCLCQRWRRHDDVFDRRVSLFS